MIQPFTSGELFCGAGGLSRGFHHAGFRPLFANDLWVTALRTFLTNFDEGFREKGEPSEVLPLEGSVSDLDVKDVLTRVSAFHDVNFEMGTLDVLLGGPPCQGYSVNSHNRRAEDPRNALFRDYIRLVQGLAPKLLVLENVPGMFSLQDGRFIEELTASLGKEVRGCPGYEVRFKILNAAHYGVPQERFRIVVVGTRRDVADEVGSIELPVPLHFSFAQAHFKGGRSHTFHYAIGHDERVVRVAGSSLQRPVTVSEAISDLPPLTNGSGDDDRSYAGAKRPRGDYQTRMRGAESRLKNHWCRVLFPPNTERVKHIPAGGDWRSIPLRLLPPGMRRALRKDHTTRYGRLDADGLSGTLLTKPDPHWGTFLHYDLKQQRLISVREAARLQSFPDEHHFLGGQVEQYRLVGNAVPPLLAEAVAAEVVKALSAFRRTGSRRGGRRNYAVAGAARAKA